MSDKRKININGSISGIANFGSNSININMNKENNIDILKDKYIEKSDISKNNNFIELEKDKFSNNIIKIIIEIVVGVIISVIAGYILYKLNIN
ncbi:MAG: hypothetical protein HFJ41_01350 [Clostridia bacterium]|nr:hypothetical protein [Clostridia bacterium]